MKKFLWLLVFFIIAMFVFRPPVFGMFGENNTIIYITKDGQKYPLPPKLDKNKRDIEKNKRCLAHAMFFEVRKNDPKEMAMVGNVIVNRTKSGLYPDEVCEVVARPDQFPWAKFGTGDRKLLKLIKSSQAENTSWNTARMVSDSVIDGKATDLTHGAIAFHANSMRKPRSNYWNSLKLTVKSNLHTFYAKF